MAGLQATRADLENVARQTRATFGMPRGPVRNVVETIEDHGLVVIRLPLDTADVDAFSLPFHDRPVVVLGADKNDRARSRFDAAHELGHLVAHGDQVWGVKDVEQQAHYFAAEFLMPARCQGRIGPRLAQDRARPARQARAASTIPTPAGDTRRATGSDRTARRYPRCAPNCDRRIAHSARRPTLMAAAS